MCDTQKVEVPPSLNAMEGTGREARERKRGPQEEGTGQKGKVGRAIKFKGLKLHTFHRFIVLVCLLLAVQMQVANSVLQRKCSAALAIRKSLASARLSIKCGVVPSVGDCATLHKAAIAEISEEKLTSRFGALQDEQDDPEPEAEPPAATRCVHRLNSDYSSRGVKGLQTCCWSHDCGRSQYLCRGAETWHGQ